MHKITELKNKIRSEKLQDIANDIVNLYIRGSVGIIELNSPKNFNALSTEIIYKIGHILGILTISNNIKVVVI